MNWQSVFRLIKWVVPLCIVLIIYKKFYKNSLISPEAFISSFISLPLYWYLVLPGFAILNWFLEIRKWQFLASRLEPHALRKAVKSVLSGVAVSQLLPYRTGEYLGRLAYISDRNKIHAGILSVVGSFSQLIVTLIFGIAAFLYIHPFDFPVSFTISFLSLLCLLILGYFYMPQFNGLKQMKFFEAIHSALHLLNKRDLFIVLCYSCLRYFTFLMPFALLASHFKIGTENTLLYYMTAVACIYFLQTISPNFILTDIAVRITVSSLVFSGSVIASNGLDHLPGMIIYLFNVALPMCLGAVVLIFLKLKRIQ